MNGRSKVRRFAPLAAVAAIQLLLVVLVPSVGIPAGYNLSGGSVLTPGIPGVPGTVDGGAGNPGAPSSSQSPVGPSGIAPPVGAGSASAGSVSSGQTAKVSGDTSHCVGGRQFDEGIDYYAPPCTPGLPGAPYANNGGATWQGVSKDAIEIVNYVPDAGAEVDTVLKAQGTYYNSNQAKILNAAFAGFINERYQLYGRKVHIDTFQGTCQTVPPNLQCLIPEMDTLVSRYHPYAVMYSTTLCSACFAELARLRVVSTGGSGFSDAFHNATAPYTYDASMSSSRVEQHFADWWCHQMTSQGGSGRTAIFAGNQNPAQDFRGKSRVLGVISTNDPDNQATVKNVLFPALKRGCGENVTHDYYYAQDINTATQQSQAGIARMNTASNPATTMLCLCDTVAPGFVYDAAANNNYWPESLIATTQGLDLDSIAQSYVDKGGKSSLACPRPQQGCTFDNTIGLGAADPQASQDQGPGYKTYTIGSNNANVPAGIDAPTLDQFWDNYNLLASLISNTGPVLTPARMQSAAPGLGSRGGTTTGHALRKFAPGDWCWIQDVRVTYFNKHKTSPFNGAPGSYVSVEGQRFDLGQFPTLKQPPAPLAANRT